MAKNDRNGSTQKSVMATVAGALLLAVVGWALNNLSTTIRDVDDKINLALKNIDDKIGLDINRLQTKFSVIEAKLNLVSEQFDTRLSEIAERLNVTNFGGRITSLEAKLIPRDEAMPRIDIINNFEILEQRLERFASSEAVALAALNKWKDQHDKIIAARDTLQCAAIASLQSKVGINPVIDCGAGAESGSP